MQLLDRSGLETGDSEQLKNYYYSCWRDKAIVSRYESREPRGKANCEAICIFKVIPNPFAVIEVNEDKACILNHCLSVVKPSYLKDQLILRQLQI